MLLSMGSHTTEPQLSPNTLGTLLEERRETSATVFVFIKQGSTLETSVLIISILKHILLPNHSDKPTRTQIILRTWGL